MGGYLGRTRLSADYQHNIPQPTPTPLHWKADKLLLLPVDNQRRLDV